MHLGVCSILFSEFYMLCVHAIKGYNVTDKNERLRNDIYSIILGLLVVAVWIHIAIYEGKSIDGYDNAYLFDVVFDY